MSAQSIREAQQLFTEKKYEAAKPIFQKYLNQSPQNGNYNYWFGVCCFETGEVDKAIPYLEKGVERRMVNASLFLAKAYAHNYRYDEAIPLMETYISQLQKRKEPVERFESLLSKFRQGDRMLHGVERITVIDSFVVDKDNFLQAMHLSKEAGKIEWDSQNQCASFTNEMGDKQLISILRNGKKGLYTSIRLIDKWSDPEPMGALNQTDINLNYPFVSSDGITLYFASDDAQGLGSYDIYVTRFEPETNRYLKPDNIGFPFNSPYNDYLYAIDEFNNLGWFVSDRFQPEGKVCVYVFVPNEQKIVYDYDTTDPKQLVQLARLTPIRLTQTDAARVREAKQRLASVKYAQEDKQTRPQIDFTFVVSDDHIYHRLDDFRSEKARQLYQTLQQQTKDLQNLSSQLQQLRDNYAHIGESDKKQEIPRILDLENRIKGLYLEIKRLNKQVLTEEHAVLNR